MCVKRTATSSSGSNSTLSASCCMAYSVLPTPGAPRKMKSSRGNLGQAALCVAYRTMARRALAPSCAALSFRKTNFASCATHSSRPLRTAAAMEASSCISSSSSLSSPMVTMPRRMFGAKLGGRGTSSLLTSPLTSSRLTPRDGGFAAGGLGPSPTAAAVRRPPLPAGVDGTEGGGAEGGAARREVSSSFTALKGGTGAAGEGRLGASSGSSASSALMATRSALGANLLLKTRRRSW
mmetsp:Transcript_119752/g.298725  ORF Transcript_119752/g.298725 Transcript_119752/m.298725 type:complete len:237 (+) Transcript_119752:849-1559(+)